MTEFTVFVDDNFHYMDKDERWTYGQYATYEEALSTAKAIVDGSLREQLKPGVTNTEMLAGYRAFGDDPFISPTPEGRPLFSGWDYAEARCADIIAVAEEQGKPT